jgi:hypothetical protein
MEALEQERPVARGRNSCQIFIRGPKEIVLYAPSLTDGRVELA